MSRPVWNLKEKAEVLGDECLQISLYQENPFLFRNIKFKDKSQPSASRHLIPGDGRCLEAEPAPPGLSPISALPLWSRRGHSTSLGPGPSSEK